MTWLSLKPLRIINHYSTLSIFPLFSTGMILQVYIYIIIFLFNVNVCAYIYIYTPLNLTVSCLVRSNTAFHATWQMPIVAANLPRCVHSLEARGLSLQRLIQWIEMVGFLQGKWMKTSSFTGKMGKMSRFALKMGSGYGSDLSFIQK